MRQIDLICSQCPLEKCDEQSLWCILSALTKPNSKQRGVRAVFRKEKAHLAEDRTEYYKSYYRENREEKLKAANARNARLRNGVL